MGECEPKPKSSCAKLVFMAQGRTPRLWHLGVPCQPGLLTLQTVWRLGLVCIRKGPLLMPRQMIVLQGPGDLAGEGSTNRSSPHPVFPLDLLHCPSMSVPNWSDLSCLWNGT